MTRQESKSLRSTKQQIILCLKKSSINTMKISTCLKQTLVIDQATSLYYVIPLTALPHGSQWALPFSISSLESTASQSTLLTSLTRFILTPKLAQHWLEFSSYLVVS